MWLLTLLTSNTELANFNKHVMINTNLLFLTQRQNNAMPMTTASTASTSATITNITTIVEVSVIVSSSRVSS